MKTCDECETVKHCLEHGCVPKQPAPVSKDEALKLALEALEWMVANDDTNEGDEPVERLGGQSWNEYNAYWLNGLNNSRAAITAIKQALAAPTVQEPVVFYRCNGCGHAYEQVHPTSCDCMEAGGFDRVEYYTTPPAQRQWVEVEQVKWDGEKFIAKLKEKNNG